ncbi:MAG: hypothetical protein Q9216_006894 [Gyalolechia sp. 2 TL-2023]
MARFKFSIIITAYLHGLLVSSMVSTGRAGHGLVGYGISMYNPQCAFACRDVLSTSILNCSEPADMSHGMGMAMSMESETSPECYATDDAFLSTLAYCMTTHCQQVATWKLEKYWNLNVAGRSPNQPIPKATYERTLASINTKPNETLMVGEELNQTMVISDEDYQGSYNAQSVFEEMERNHETYGIILIITGAAIPIAFSLLRFAPFPAASVTKFNAWLVDPPAFGSRHKAPIAGLFHMPTRGQAFFIFYIVGINVILSAAGYKSRQPNSWYPSVSGSDGEIISCVTNRLGVLSFANIPLLFLYAGRNNVLLWLTNWSHGTFLLLHRWVAWIATIQAVLHSAIYLEMYIHTDTHASESKLPYWIWGIVATLCMSLLLPTSILPIRKRFYEFFLAWHVLLSIFVLVGCLWHILERFQRQWGYENWIYTAIAIWGFERAMRLARVARNGIKTARVTVIDEDYIQVNIDDVTGSGHAYLYFPTLTWRVWENHPFSVASAVLPRSEPPVRIKHEVDLEKIGSSTDSSGSGSPERQQRQSPAQIGLTFLLRTKAGVTGQLRKHARLPVLIESAYGPHEDLSEYALLICIAGGVGITACLPYLRAHPGATKLFWGARSHGVVDAMTPSLTGVEKETFVGQRMNISEVLYRELSDAAVPAVVLVSGPSEMADEVRCVVSELGKGGKGLRVKLMEEAFSW